jgi:glycosyltransferase involved in cell wall biosynthesis
LIPHTTHTTPGAARPEQATLRIALFTGAYNHIADGVSLTLNRLVAHLESTGARVLVFAPTIEDPPIEHAGTLVSAPSIQVPGRPEYRLTLRLPRSARERLEAFRPTLVHIATPDRLGLAARRWALKHDIPLVSSYHTHFSSYLKYYNLSLLEGALWAYLRWFYRACRQIYVPTPSMAGVLREHGITEGLLPWPRGVDTDRFNPQRRSYEWRRSLGIADDEVVLTFISRLVWEKGPDVFAAVVAALTERGIPHRSLIVGDGPARADLEERLPRTIFTGYLSGGDLARAYASADVFLFPSETETFGNVTLEAMASGLPTICAEATGSMTLVQHGETGFLAPPRQLEAFLGFAEQLITDAGRREQMGTVACEHAQSYAWPALLDRLMGYYHDVFEPHPTANPSPNVTTDL